MELECDCLNCLGKSTLKDLDLFIKKLTKFKGFSCTDRCKNSIKSTNSKNSIHSSNSSKSKIPIAIYRKNNNFSTSSISFDEFNTHEEPFFRNKSLDRNNTNLDRRKTVLKPNFDIKKPSPTDTSVLIKSKSLEGPNLRNTAIKETFPFKKKIDEKIDHFLPCETTFISSSRENMMEDVKSFDCAHKKSLENRINRINWLRHKSSTEQIQTQSEEKNGMRKIWYT